MKDTFVQLSEYIESLEQRIAALETRAAALESRALDADLHRQETEDQLKDAMAQLAASAARIAALETMPPVPSVQVPVTEQEEPEVEVELVVEEDDPEEETQTVEEPQPEPDPESEPQPQPDRPTVYAPHQTSLFGAPVTDIRQAISIGDRFLFQRELFAGNGEALQKMLDRLNAAADWAEAIDIVSQQNWDKESSTYELFLNVLRRRFNESM